MSQKNPTKKKKVVVTTSNGANTGTLQNKKKIKPTVSRTKAKGRTASKKPETMIFGRENFKFMFIGIALIALGLIFMAGGGMPDPEIWDEGIIYSWQRTVLAPFLIIVGLVVEIYATFRKAT